MIMNITIGSRYNYKHLFVLPFEETYDYRYQNKWMTENWTVSFYFLAAYLFFIFKGQELMKPRPRYELRTALIVWNVLLAVFSFSGFLRTFPEFYYSLSEFGFHHSVCVPSFMLFNKVSGFWSWMFCASKLFELVDTVFIVLRKQKLIFLHWYHHVIVVVYCWSTYNQHTAMVRWFIWINYLVHGFMYSYFALRALKVHIPKWIAVTITSAQIIQMVVACTISCYAYNFVNNGIQCNVLKETAVFAFAMYLSFFVLFFNFFVNVYFFVPSRTVSIEKSKSI